MGAGVPSSALRLRAFTLIELLVVVAIIGLLISILLPSLQGAKEQSKKVRCLANLGSIGRAMQVYASEENDVIGPMNRYYGLRKNNSWLNFTADWIASWGGRSAPDPFKVSASASFEINDTGDITTDGGLIEGLFAAKYRPLNAYVGVTDLEPVYDSGGQPTKLGSAYDLPLFECPSDAGYYDAPPNVIDDSPRANAERRCYDTLGNSYRASMAGAHTGSWKPYITWGPWGAQISKLSNTSRMILAGEPTFFNMIGLNGASGVEIDPIWLIGWHKRFLTDNLIFVDGHAEATFVGDRLRMDNATMQAADICLGEYTSRGPTWQLDCYPAKARLLRGAVSPWNYPCWPFE
jgi:prepilin-type N-terminal cleavage/methylation domain-containing protein